MLKCIRVSGIDRSWQRNAWQWKGFDFRSHLTGWCECVCSRQCGVYSVVGATWILQSKMHTSWAEESAMPGALCGTCCFIRVRAPASSTCRVLHCSGNWVEIVRTDPLGVGEVRCSDFPAAVPTLPVKQAWNHSVNQGVPTPYQTARKQLRALNVYRLMTQCEVQLTEYFKPGVPLFLNSKQSWLF